MGSWLQSWRLKTSLKPRIAIFRAFVFLCFLVKYCLEKNWIKIVYFPLKCSFFGTSFCFEENNPSENYNFQKTCEFFKKHIELWKDLSINTFSPIFSHPQPFETTFPRISNNLFAVTFRAFFSPAALSQRRFNESLICLWKKPLKTINLSMEGFHIKNLSLWKRRIFILKKKASASSSNLQVRSDKTLEHSADCRYSSVNVTYMFPNFRFASSQR